VVFFHVPSGATSVNGFATSGWTHQIPLLANTTTRWPVRAPRTRPAIDAVRCSPPSAAFGTSVNVMEGGSLLVRFVQPLTIAANATTAVPRRTMAARSRALIGRVGTRHCIHSVNAAQQAVGDR
jgi:hypothetical protein